MELPKETVKGTKQAFRPKDAAISFLALSLLSAAAIFAMIVYDVVSVRDLLDFRGPGSLLVITALASAGLLLYALLLVRVTPAGAVDETNRTYQEASLGGILAFMFLGALFEELLFRGIVQNLLAVYTGSAWLAVLITTVLFLAIHVQYYRKPLMLVNIALPSIVFGWIYLQTGNILVPVIAHFIMNAGTTLLFKYKLISMK